MRDTRRRIRHDYKTPLPATASRPRSRSIRWIALGVSLPLLAIGAASVALNRPATPPPAPTDSMITRGLALPGQELGAASPAPAGALAGAAGATAAPVQRAVAPAPATKQPGPAAADDNDAEAADTPAGDGAPKATGGQGPAVAGPPPASAAVEVALAVVPAPAPAAAAPTPAVAAAAITPAVAAPPRLDGDMIVGIPLALPAPPSDPGTAAGIDDGERQPALRLTIARGDTLDGLFGQHGLSRGDLVRMLAVDEASRHLRLLQVGDELLVEHDGDGRVHSLERRIDAERTLHVRRGEGGFLAEIDFNPVERRLARARGEIRSSLFLAAKRAGISDTLAMNIAGVFAWDIDFVLDIRQGDSFTVLYEELWQDGLYIGDGDVVAAEFVNDGERFRAVRFVDPNGDTGYFTPEGINVRKAFLRAPIAITPRVTSNFNPRRRHPVYKTVRPHRGVDYGAPPGTPIKAAGDGKVTFRGRKGGYGNTVILQHGGNITTLYAHMSKFNRRSRPGSRVKQGQIIGYVGATGTVTGPHLHYEYRVSGVHRNPRTVKLPKADPVPAQYRDAFSTQSAPLLAQLDVVSRSLRLASAD